MFQKVIVIHERPNSIRIPEIHAEGDAGILHTLLVQVRYIDRIPQEGLIHHHAVPLCQHEVNLVNVKGVRLPRPVFYHPVLDISLPHRDVGLGRMGIEGRRKWKGIEPHEVALGGF